MDTWKDVVFGAVKVLDPTFSKKHSKFNVKNNILLTYVLKSLSRLSYDVGKDLNRVMSNFVKANGVAPPSSPAEVLLDFLFILQKNLTEGMDEILFVAGAGKTNVISLINLILAKINSIIGERMKTQISNQEILLNILQNDVNMLRTAVPIYSFQQTISYEKSVEFGSVKRDEQHADRVNQHQPSKQSITKISRSATNLQNFYPIKDNLRVVLERLDPKMIQSKLKSVKKLEKRSLAVDMPKEKVRKSIRLSRKGCIQVAEGVTVSIREDIINGTKRHFMEVLN